MLPQILTTRIHVPRFHHTFIARPHLTALVNAGIHQKLTLLRTPVGFGKTTLLAEWVAHYQPPVAWLSLNQADNVPATLFGHLLAALQTAQPDLLTTVTLDQDLTAPSACQLILTTLINEITNFPKQVILVLDDYHLIDNKMIQDWIAFLLENLPPQMHLIMTTRSEPALPLAHLRMRGQVNEFDMNVLRFTREEASRFLQHSLAAGLTEEQITALFQHTEGWIDGLRMAANSLQKLSPAQYNLFVAEFTVGNRQTIEYFWEEVLHKQPAHLQDFLIQTSILGHLNRSLCQAVTGDARAQEFLQLIERSDLFVIPVDRRRETYRYHKMFAHSLLQRLQQTAPEQIAELHRRASRWYEEHALLQEAVKHALAAHDWQRARHLIDTNAEMMATATQLKQLNRWLEIGLTEIDFSAAEAWIQSTSGVEERVLSLAANHDSQASLRALAIGRVYLLLGQVNKAETVLSGLDLTAPELSDPPTQITLINALGQMCVAQGKLHLAAATYQPFLELLAEQPPDPLYVKYYCGLVHLYYEWNQLEKAQAMLDRCFRNINPEIVSHPHLIESYLWQAHIGQILGNEHAANQALQDAVLLARKLEHLRALDQVKAHQARLFLRQGRLHDALEWYRTSGLSPADSIIYRRQFEYLTVARIFIAHGQSDQALPLLTHLLNAAEAAGRVGDCIEILALRALAHRAGGSPTDAFSDMANALCQAEHERYVRTFVNEGAPMAALLREAAARGVTVLYVEQLLKSVTKPPLIPQLPTPKVNRVVPPADKLVEPLSERELEVLRLVASGQTNREVAEVLFISPTTVKKHMSNILGKLGTHNRTQAAAKARRVGLI